MNDAVRCSVSSLAHSLTSMHHRPPLHSPAKFSSVYRRPTVELRSQTPRFVPSFPSATSLISQIRRIFRSRMLCESSRSTSSPSSTPLTRSEESQSEQRKSTRWPSTSRSWGTRWRSERLSWEMMTTRMSREARESRRRAHDDKLQFSRIGIVLPLSTGREGRGEYNSSLGGSMRGGAEEYARGVTSMLDCASARIPAIRLSSSCHSVE